MINGSAPAAPPPTESTTTCHVPLRPFPADTSWFGTTGHLDFLNDRIWKLIRALLFKYLICFDGPIYNHISKQLLFNYCTKQIRSLSNLCMRNSPPVSVPETKKDTGRGRQMDGVEVGADSLGDSCPPQERCCGDHVTEH